MDLDKLAAASGGIAGGVKLAPMPGFRRVNVVELEQAIVTGVYDNGDVAKPALVG